MTLSPFTTLRAFGTLSPFGTPGSLSTLGSPMTECPPTTFRLAVPAYFHPAYDPTGWRVLAALGDTLSFAILNPDSGPGRAADPAYLEPIAAVQAAGGRVIGYVDTDYGRRTATAVLSDMMLYQSWYGLCGVFLDQVCTGREQLPHYRLLADAARRSGFDLLVVNPGSTPDPGYAELADIVVTFEGPWRAYRDHVPADWTRHYPAERFCHLVHSTPPAQLAAANGTARAHHVGAFYITELTGANPWGSLSAQLAGIAPT